MKEINIISSFIKPETMMMMIKTLVCKNQPVPLSTSIFNNNVLFRWDCSTNQIFMIWYRNFWQALPIKQSSMKL